MATTGHCAYCFEVLVADLENRKPLSYRQVQDLWEQYQLLGKPKADGHEAAVLEDGDEPDDEDGEMDGVEEEEDEQEADGMQEQKQPPSTLQLPSISRLQAPSSGPPSSSSSSLSTPSSHATSKSSSATSFFSTTPRSKQPSPTAPPKEEPPHPLFITWSTLSPHHQKSLRGCIGTFDPQPLPTGLKSYALTA